MKSIMKPLICCVFLMTFVISCNIPKAIAPSITNTPSNIWATWLSASVCEPPCWQGITPGVTTLSDAVSILEGTPDVMMQYQDQQNVSWYFKDNKEGGAIWATEDGIVSFISLASISDTKLLLQTVVDIYGDPQYVKPSDCREGMCVTALVYPDLGMYLSTFVPNNGNVYDPKVEISSDTAIDRVYFLIEGINNFEKIPDMQHYDLLMEWKGYTQYP